MISLEDIKIAKPEDEFEFVCKCCGKIFTKTKKYISKNSYKLPVYCSRKCRKNDMSAKYVKVVCKSCGKEKEITIGEYNSKINKSGNENFFCNSSCAAKYNNHLYPKRNKQDSANIIYSERDKRDFVNSIYTICPICGGKKCKNSSLCKKCSDKEKRNVGDKELGYFVGYGDNRVKYISTKCQDIRRDAKRVLTEDNEREKVCEYCKNHEFDSILEVHHLKPIASFDETAKVKEINDKNNLVWLCPNHHTMLERGLIQLNHK